MAYKKQRSFQRKILFSGTLTKFYGRFCLFSGLLGLFLLFSQQASGQNWVPNDSEINLWEQNPRPQGIFQDLSPNQGREKTPTMYIDEYEVRRMVKFIPPRDASGDATNRSRQDLSQQPIFNYPLPAAAQPRTAGDASRGALNPQIAPRTAPALPPAAKPPSSSNAQTATPKSNGAQNFGSVPVEEANSSYYIKGGAYGAGAGLLVGLGLASLSGGNDADKLRILGTSTVLGGVIGLLLSYSNVQSPAPSSLGTEDAPARKPNNNPRPISAIDQPALRFAVWSGRF